MSSFQQHLHVLIHVKIITTFPLKMSCYATPRNVLLNTVCSILTSGVAPDLIVHLADNILVKYFTHGNKELPDKLNEDHFEAVNLFIMETRRHFDIISVGAKSLFHCSNTCMIFILVFLPVKVIISTLYSSVIHSFVPCVLYIIY